MPSENNTKGLPLADALSDTHHPFEWRHCDMKRNGKPFLCHSVFVAMPRGNSTEFRRKLLLIYYHNPKIMQYQVQFYV